jgi:hypothetical protein
MFALTHARAPARPRRQPFAPAVEMERRIVTEPA